MTERDWLAQRFEQNRPHLRAVAYRMLGSPSEVEDAVQEAWIRLSRSDTRELENLTGWLTTVVARVCVDMLRSRESRREETLDEGVPRRSRPPCRLPTPSRGHCSRTRSAWSCSSCWRG